MILIEHVLAFLAVFLLLSVLASKVSVRSGIPALMLFLGLGMLAGSDGPGGIYFDYPWIAQSVGVIALAFILFSGGLDTSWHDIRPVVWHGLALSTIGVVVTALAVGVFVSTVFGFTLLEGVLLGAIISSTDAAAVFAILRGKGVRLRGRLKPLLELESGSNDPMAVFLTLGMIQLIVNPGLSPLALIPLFITQMGIGALAGFVMGRAALAILNRIRLEYDGLYPVLSVALVLFTYGITATVGGNGFLAVYLVGVIIAQKDFIHKRSLLQFHDGVAWLMQIAMFVTLGLQVYPSRLPAVFGMGVVIALFLIFVARPLSVFIALSFSRTYFTKKLFIALVGLRGAAPIVLATFPLLAGIDKAQTYFDLVFFIVLTSVMLQGPLLIPLAKLLYVYDPGRPPKSPLNFVMQDGIIANDLLELTIERSAPADGQRILDLHLPKDAIIVLIGRRDDMLVPRGDTQLQAGDKILLISGRSTREQVKALFASPAGTSLVTTQEITL